MILKKRKIILAVVFCFISINIGFFYSQFLQTDDARADIDNHHNEGGVFSANALLTKNRDKTIVCIQDYTTQESKFSLSKTHENLTSSLEKLKEHENWKSSGLSAFEMEVQTKCSLTPRLLEPNATHPIYSGKNSTPRFVNIASDEIVGVFVVDQSVIDEHFKEAPTRWSPEQVICENDECNEVTRGSYLTRGEPEAKEADILYHELIYGLGIESVVNTIESNNKTKEQQKNDLLEKQKGNNDGTKSSSSN